MGRILLSICAVVVASALSGPAAVYGQPIEVRGRDATESASSPEQRAPLNVTLVESEDQAKRGEEREAKSDEHERLDLIAQQKAANAAYFAAFFSGLGTLRIVGALVQTSLANMRQMRAYVGVDCVKLDVEEDGSLAVGISVKNFGQTPAYRFDGYCLFSVEEIGNKTTYPPHEIMPLHNVNMTFSAAQPLVAGIVSGALAMSLQGGGTYKDLAGRKRTMRFSMAFDVPTQSLIAVGDNRSD